MLPDLENHAKRPDHEIGEEIEIEDQSKSRSKKKILKNLMIKNIKLIQKNLMK